MKLTATAAVLILMNGVLSTAIAQTSPDWQQHVHYKMDVTLKADSHKLVGTQWLTYQNNSPDTLHILFYHLYFNAFQPTSMMAERNRHLPDPDGRVVPRIWNLSESEIGYHRIRSLTQSGVRLPFKVTDTVMRVELNEPIAPGTSTVIKMTFDSQVPLQTRRSGRDSNEGVDYSMSQWYPKVAAYDGRGWHADPYIGREFYAPFGTFEVSIKLPANYILGGTGVVQNPNEVGHGYQNDNARKFAHSPSDSLTWIFKAENVHDFAWVADTEYVHEKIEGGDGVVYHLLYLEDVKDRWTTMNKQVPAIIQSLSRQIGQYPYPQFTVAQAGDGGMEYPMINFITGRRSPQSLLGVVAHEAAHEWFYGVLGSNEADYSWMDEGFTSYISSRAMSEVMQLPPPTSRGQLQGYVTIQKYGIDDRLSTPADWYETNTAFSIASYTGGALIADMLGYVMSDDVRDEWLREYFRRFKFKHPNPYDVEKVAEDVSGLVLDWFFEQFTNTTRTLDYGIESMDSFRRGEMWASEVVIERDDAAVMPVDVKLTLEDGTYKFVTIPLGIMEGHKPVPSDWFVAPPWMWTSPEYTLVVETTAKVVSAEIDPMYRTPDYNRLNNTSSFPYETHFLKPANSQWSQYNIGYRPLLDYSASHGFGIGIDARGRYFLDNHITEATIKLWPEVLADPRGETFVDGIDWEFGYTRFIGDRSHNLVASATLAKHLGIVENSISLEKTLGSFFDQDVSKVLTFSLGHQFRESNQGFNGTIQTLPGRLWTSGNIVNARVSFDVSKDLNYISASVDVGGPIDNPADVSAQIFGTRGSVLSVDGGVGRSDGTFAAVLTGAVEVGSNDLAFQKRRILGSAPLEEQWRNPATRTLTAGLYDNLEDVHFSPVSNRGPVAYLLGGFVPTSGATGFGAVSGSNLVAANLTLSARKGPASVNVFTGIGQAWDTVDAFETDRFLADAGLGVELDVASIDQISDWVRQSDLLQNLHLTAKFPVWASDPQIVDPTEDKFEFRWLLGVNIDY